MKKSWIYAMIYPTLGTSIMISLMRDSSLLRVGDVWVADGHKLAFDILDPRTGKAKRMMLILELDWASRYPVGASLAFTEDCQQSTVYKC